MFNFKYKEAINSDKAKANNWDNNIPYDLIDNYSISLAGMQEIRNLFGKPCNVSSWYRSPKLNKAVGGSENSAHKLALAIDFTVKGVNTSEAFEKIAKSGIKFDQLILEKSSKSGSVWIHVSFDQRLRMEVKRLQKD
ncbi:MAG: D-Ala-D-Ala carboxypeptidase family metallohydrolase [Lactococcus garvieae]